MKHWFIITFLGLIGLIVALTVINNELIQGLPSSIVIISLLAYVVGCSLEYYFKIHRVDKQTS